MKKKLNNKKIIRIVLISILIISYISTAVKGATKSYGGLPPHMYDWDYNLFSAMHGAKLGGYDTWGNPSTATVYDMTSHYGANVEPSVGYAYYLAEKFGNFNSSEIQKIIWSSKQWNNSSNMIDTYAGDTTQNAESLIAKRSYQYGTVYYEILKDIIDNNKNLFKVVSEEQSVKLFVDQDMGKYTIGPYRLAINTEHTKESAVFLYNEIIGQNSGETEDTAFAKYTGMSGLNGDNENAIFLNQDGKQITFPNFVNGEIFYIRFTPNNDGAIQNTGKPEINVEYASNFKANELIEYNPIAVQFGGSAGDYEAGNISGVSNNNNQYNFDKVTDSDIHSQYSTDPTPEGRNAIEDQKNDKRFRDTETNELKELNELLDDDDRTLPGESELDAESRDFYYSIINSGTVALLVAAVIGGLTGEVTGTVIAALGGFALETTIRTVVQLADGALRIFNIELPFLKEDVNNIILEDLDALDVVKQITDILYGTANPFELFKTIINNFAKKKIGDWLDLSDVEIRKSIEALAEYGIIKEEEKKYALRILELYGDNATTFGDWIAAYRNGYKLPLNLVLQAYDNGGKIKDEDVSDKEVILLKKLGQYYPGGTITNPPYYYYSAKLEGTAVIDISIPALEGSFINCKGIKIKAEKILDSIGPFISDAQAKQAAKNNKEDWNAVGFEDGEDYYDPGAKSLPVGGETGSSTSGANYTFEKLNGSGSGNYATGRKIVNNHVEISTNSDKTVLKDIEINMHIDGYTFLDQLEKIDINANVDGKIGGNDLSFRGLEVSLYEVGKKDPVATTTTDEKGRYSFFGLKEANIPLINPLKKYKVSYKYNGQIYQPTYYKNDISGLYSATRENENVRKDYNEEFKNIYSENKGYEKDGEWHKSYAFTEKVKKDDDSFIYQEGVPLTFGEVYVKFLTLAKQNEAELPQNTDGGKMWNREKSYDWVLDNPNNSESLSNWLVDLGANGEVKPVIQNIRDTLITADVGPSYPAKNQFVINSVDTNVNTYQYDDPYYIKLDKDFTYLYTKSSDQSKFVNFGLTQRTIDAMVVQNDIYRITTTVNGKLQDYFYDEKSTDKWNLQIRAIDDQYNERAEYTRKIRKSDYLYNTENKDSKNLEVYVTYRITATNRGGTNVAVDEIVDYYDKDAYEFDGVLSNDNDTYELNTWYNYDSDGNPTNKYYNSFIGKNPYGDKLNYDLVVKETGLKGVKHEDLRGENYNYGTIYLTGISSENGKILKPGESVNVYVTFKVKKDNNNRIKVDDSNSIGKKNIAEINAYSTYYLEGTRIPKTLDNNDNINYEEIKNNDTTSGIVSTVATPGGLSTVDLNDEGDIITGNMDRTDEDGKELFNYSTDRQELDIDKAPNLKLVIDDNDRTIRGYTFEDARNNTENTGKAVIGNGLYNSSEGDTKINGVTVELVELVKDVDEDGVSMGTYSGEKIWDSYTYSINNNDSPSVDNSRYASGQGKSRVIISGNDNLQVNANNLEEGEYEFKSIPPGDFFVRFKYGDTAETTMIASDKLEARENELKAKDEWRRTEAEKVELGIIEDIKEVNNSVKDIDGMSGKNKKSYNGQDYKSTIYQKDMSQDTNYNGINGYTRIEEQNYSSDDDNKANDGVDKFSMYYYDIAEGDKHQQSSDAKDVYYYRKKTNDYSKGENGKTVLNNRAEILSSFERMGTYVPYEYNESGLVKYEEDNPVVKIDEQNENQKQMIRELMNNTQMVSQTGIINMEVEYNRKKTVSKGEDLSYSLNNLNLGLTERPVSQLSIYNKVDNVRVVSTSGKVLFDTAKSVNNLYYSEHQSHSTIFNRDPRLLMRTYINKNKDGKGTADLIQAYIDDELRAGTRIELRYKMSISNTGEVDYLDKKFYYNGIEDNPDNLDNISKTSASKVVDYICNAMQFSGDVSNQGENWKVGAINELMPSTIVKNRQPPETNMSMIDKDYINRQYAYELNTYNTVLMSSKFDNELVPIVNENGRFMTDVIELNVSTDISKSSEQNKLAYNNLAEIIEMSNSLGRRCRYSVVGNEEMADQSLGNNAKGTVKTSVDRIKPTEIDADSAQKVLIIPPTGYAYAWR